jgi:hypothetical protein
MAERTDVELAAMKTANSILKNKPEDGKGKFMLRAVGSLAIRAPSWLVRDLLEADSLAVVFGPPGSAKSFLALELAACIATGAPFHGRPVARPGLVVYAAGEGHAGLARRLKAWSIARCVDLATAPLLVSEGPAGLCLEESVAAVEVAIAEAVLSMGPPALIVFDTWSRNLSGDENSSLDSALGVAAVDRLRKTWSAAALVVHHEGWTQGRARGSTVLRAAADLELRVERGGDGIVRVEPTKVKDAGPSGPLAFSLADVDLGILDEDGRPVNSAVLTEEEYRPEAAPKPATGKNQTLALEVLEAEIIRHRENVKASGRDPAAARVSVGAWRDACAVKGMDRRRFAEAKAALVAAGAVKLDGTFIFLASETCPKASESVRGSPSSPRPNPSEGPIRPRTADGQTGKRADGQTDTKVTASQPPQPSVGGRPVAAEPAPASAKWPNHHKKGGEAVGATWEDLGAEPEGVNDGLDIF